MKLTTRQWFTSVLIASAAALTLAPVSHAADVGPQGCHTDATATVCQQPGNAQLTTHQPAVQFHPYGNLPGPPTHQK